MPSECLKVKTTETGLMLALCSVLICRDLKMDNLSTKI
jgi:hypothetical protein